MARIRIKKRPTEPEPIEHCERESDLCERFAAAASLDGWKVFPEVDDWDLVLVWDRDDVPALSNDADSRELVDIMKRRGRAFAALAMSNGIRRGDQLGVEAKLRPTTEVLAQVLNRPLRSGPDFRAILVPDAPWHFDTVARALGVQVFSLQHCAPWRPGKIGPEWRRGYLRDRLTIQPVPIRWERNRRLWLPPVPSFGPAGQPSPSPLTKWRVAAIRLCRVLRDRGWVTIEDFNREKISIHTWRKLWIDPTSERSGKLKIYRLRPDAVLPDVEWEREAAAMEELRRAETGRPDVGRQDVVDLGVPSESPDPLRSEAGRSGVSPPDRLVASS